MVDTIGESRAPSIVWTRAFEVEPELYSCGSANGLLPAMTLFHRFGEMLAATRFRGYGYGIIGRRSARLRRISNGEAG